MTGLCIAVVGDVHHHFDADDVRLFDAQGYDLVIFVGDLAGLRLSGTLAVARCIAGLRTPAVVMPGNHDAPTALQLLGELLGQGALVRLSAGPMPGRRVALVEALGGAPLLGYSRHPLGEGLTLIAGRPHSMGGPELAFAPFLAREFGVSSMQDSTARLCSLVDEVDGDALLFVGHNGPTGQGSARGSIWGRDFTTEPGDHGDPDLEAAVAYAKRRGLRVAGVVAGHMHRGLRGGGQRVSLQQDDGVTYVNAARVPRIWDEDGRRRRHHVALRWDGAALRVEEVIW